MARPVQRLEGRQTARLLQVRAAALLDLPEPDYLRWISDLEKDPLFARLRETGADGRRVLRRRPWSGSRWHAPLDESAAGAASRSADVPAGVAALIRKVGREDFEQFFLYNDGAVADEKAAAACGLTPEEAATLRGYVDGWLLQSGLFEREAPAAPGAGQDVVAVIEPADGGFLPAWTSTHYARGRYDVDYERLEALKRTGAFGGDTPRLKDVLARIELANARQTALAGVLRLAVRTQAAFLRSGDPGTLKTMTQREAAEKLGLSASAVCRAVAGRSVRLPSGGEAPLADLLPSRRDVAVGRVGNLLARTPSLTGRELARALAERWKIRVTVRSANDYRREAAKRGVAR